MPDSAVSVARAVQNLPKKAGRERDLPAYVRRDAADPSIDGVVVSRPSEFRRALRGVRSDIGTITVPAARARRTADLFACIGVGEILNMAPACAAEAATARRRPVKLGPIGNVTVSNVDLALELEKLSYDLVLGAGARAQPLEVRPA